MTPAVLCYLKFTNFSEKPLWSSRSGLFFSVIAPYTQNLSGKNLQDKRYQ